MQLAKYFRKIESTDVQDGESLYLFDRGSFAEKAASRGLFNELSSPAFWEVSEGASMSAEIGPQSYPVHVKKSNHYLAVTPRGKLTGVGFHRHTEGYSAAIAGEGSKPGCSIPAG